MQTADIQHGRQHEQPDDQQATAPPARQQQTESEPVPEPSFEIAPVDPVALRDAAMLALQDDDDESAYQFVRQAMRLTPDDPQLVFVHALVLGKRNRFPEAIQILDDLAKEVPETRLPALGQTADWLVQFGQYSDAEERYRQLLSIAPDAALVRRQLATLLIRQGHRIDAASHLRYLCGLGDIQETELRTLLSVANPVETHSDTLSSDPIGPLGIAREDIAAGNWQSARESLEGLDPIGPEEISLLGRIYFQANDFDALADWNDRLPESANRYPDAWFARGGLAAYHGDHREAVRCFAETLRLDQTDHQAYSRFSESLETVGRKSESEVAAKRADLINQTQLLATELATSGQPNDEKLDSLVDLLQKLRRPHEAIAWRGIQLAYAQQQKMLSESELRQALAEIAMQRSELQNQAVDQPAERFILCGIDVDELGESSIASPTNSRIGNQ